MTSTRSQLLSVLLLSLAAWAVIWALVWVSPAILHVLSRATTYVCLPLCWVR